MREQHPIDDLFRRVLNNAEVSPPPMVWEGVVRRRHWGHRILLHLERRWGWTLLLLLLLGAAPATYWTLRSPGAPSGTTTASAPTAAFRAEPGTTHAMNMEGESTTAQRMEPATNQGDHGGGPSNERWIAGAQKPATNLGPRHHSIGTGQDAEIPVTKSHQQAEPERQDVASEQGPQTMIAAVLDEESDRNGSWHPEEESLPPLAAVEAGRLPETTVDREQGRNIAIGNPEMVSQEPDTLPQQAPYVLAHGNYWIGAQVGFWNVNGGWSGASILSEDLNGSEEWNSQQSIVALFGRRWRSGFSLGTGVELMERDSRLLVDRAEPGTASVVVDTTWTVIPMGTATFYTWDIDSTMMIEPGAQQHYSARNQYTMLRVPIELSWSRDLRRWIFGVRAGASINLPIERSGQTLAPANAPQDATASSGLLYNVIDLNDASVDDRFGVSLSAFGGFDVGYLLTERWSAHAGPSLARDIGIGNTPIDLSTTQVGGFFRIEYELRTKERRAMNAHP